MVRPKSEGRSRGCEVCKARKIKCDQKLPQCSQCIKAKRQCLGAVSGMVFLSAKNDSESSKVNKIVYERNEEEEADFRVSPSPVSRTPSWSLPGDNDPHELDALLVPWTLESSSSPTSQPRSSREYSRSPVSPSLSLNIPHAPNNHEFARSPVSPFSSLSIPQASNYNEFSRSPVSPSPNRQRTTSNPNDYITEQFISVLLQNSRAEGTASWLLSLPSVFSQTTTLGKATLAVSLAYHGNLYGNKTLTMDAYKIYGQTLENQRRDLENSSQTFPTAEDIAVPVMLSMFESICSQSVEAYRQHILAAERLMEIRGPHACEDPVFAQILNTLKTEMLYISISTRQPSKFSREEWRTIPYQHSPATAADKLKDILLQIPILLSRLEVLTSAPATSSQVAESVNIDTDTRSILSQLDHLEEALKTDSLPTDLKDMLAHDFTTSIIRTEDPTTPMAIAYHRTAKTLSLYILSCFHRNSQEEFRAYCTTILKTAEVLFDGEALHPSYWRHVLLLKVVAFTAPRDIEAIAWAILEGWAGKTGLLGIKMRQQGLGIASD